MGKCSECGKKILYNKYKMYRGKVLCPECYNTRLERKAAKKAKLKRQAELVKITKPSKKAKKKAKEYGLTTKIDLKIDLKGDNENEDKAQEDSI